MIIKNKNTIHRSSAAIIGDVAAKLGCDISGSTDDVDLCMVTHCKHPIGYAVLRGNQWSRISEQEFNKFSKPSKHVYIESIDVSLDPDTARLPGYRNASGSDAFQALFQLPELCQKNATLLMLFVLCITAPLLSILYPLFGGSIAVVLTGIQTVSQSPVLQELLRTCGGPKKWKGKHWTATVPYSWQPHRELCAARPSDDLSDYAKLKVTAGKKSMTLPAPVVNRLVALENSIPQAVVNTVSKNYPFSLPVVLGRKLAGSERTIFTLDGNELLNYDEEMLQRLFAQHSNMQNTLKKFVVHYRKNPKDFAAEIERRAARFIPSKHDGRFTCNSADTMVHVKAKLLAVLEMLLIWGTQQNYCIYDEASAFFHTVWGTILPETSPKPPEDTTAKLNPENAYTFLLFFKKYLHDHIAGIRKEGETWDSQSVAWLRTLKNQTTLLLICGRRSLLTAYQDWLQERDVELDISAEAALQAALTEGGIPFRTGGRDTTWKYKLSPADKPLPCMGVALNDLLSLFEQHEISIGNDLGSLFSLESDDCKAEADSVAEIDESEENKA